MTRCLKGSSLRSPQKGRTTGQAMDRVSFENMLDEYYIDNRVGQAHRDT